MPLLEEQYLTSGEYLVPDQIPDYPLDLQEKVRGTLTDQQWEEISTQFCNQIAPGYLLMPNKVIDFLIYTSPPKRTGFRSKSYMGYRWSNYADSFRSPIRTILRDYYKIDLITNTDNINGVYELALAGHPFKTQKVRGIGALLMNQNLDSLHPVSPQSIELLKTAIVVPYQTEAQHIRKPFMRPCPSRPRHGFVESQEVHGIAGARELFHTARIEDPDAEMLVMEMANGGCSALAVPNMLTLAAGFSGCTSGGGPYSVAIPHSPHRYVSQYCKDEAGIRDTCYIEFVEHDKRMMPVQLRDGPAVEGCQKNYIPHDIPASAVRIIQCHDDLITYERELQSTDPKNSVVIGLGKFLTSHYGAHAISYGIPFITELSVYTQLLAGGLKQNTNTTENPQYRRIADRLSTLLSTPLSTHIGIREPDNGRITHKVARSTAYALTVAHLCPMWPKDNEVLNYITASGLYHFVGSFAAALLGELRHYKREYEGKPARITSIPKFAFSEARDGTFGRATCIPTGKLLKCLAAVEADFLSPIWGSNYGGGPWASAAMALHTVTSCMYEFIAHPNEKTWGALLRNWHTCINEEHNGGYVLNKFILNCVFNTAADSPTHLILSYRQIYELYLKEAGVANNAFTPYAVDKEEE